MKNIRLTIAALGILLGSSVPALVAAPVASADNNPANPCMVGLLSDMTTDGNTVTTKLNIPESCGSRVISLATYEMHEGSTSPLSTQKIYSFKAATFAPGDHTISNTLPEGCFYQADLWVGAAPMQLEDGVHYAYGQNDPYVAQAIVGGSEDCLNTPAPATPAPTTPAPVTPAAATTVQPTALVNTGPGDVAAVAAIATVAGAYLYRRKLAQRA